MHVSAEQEWPTGLMIIQGNRLEDLRSLMVGWMQRHPLRPLEEDVVLVQSNGIAQWLKLALAAPEGPGGGCGIAAAIDVKLPGRLIWQAYRSLLDELPKSSPFDKEPLTWRIYQLLGELDRLRPYVADTADLTPLTGFLECDADARQRYQLAARLADLYDQYQVYRADWLAAWEAGADDIIKPGGERQPLGSEQRWQAGLWRALTHAIQADPSLGEGPWSRASRAAVHHAALAAAKALEPSQRPAALPRRVIVFGVSCLPRQTLAVLEAIAHLSQVLLFVSNPSRHYWGDLIEGRELLRRDYRRNRTRKLPGNLEPAALHLHGHPLLAAWGKQGRDYLHLLDERDQPEHYRQHFGGRIDLFSSPGDATLLQQLQEDLLELRSVTERQERQSLIDPTCDDSLRFTVAHSEQREVEILQDQLLATFEQAQARGTPLQPGDVLVMVPDIDNYAAAIQAVFGRVPANDPRFLPYHIADQGQRHRNPLLIALELLLQLPRARFAVTELLDLLDISALRERYQIDAADLPRLRQWIQGANIRWGLNSEQRSSLLLPTGLEQNTWQFGLKRMLLGFAAGRAGAWRDIEPYDEVGGLEAALVGPLVALLQRLDQTWRELQQSRTPFGWSGYLQQLLADYFVETEPADSHALSDIQTTLDQWLEASAQAGIADDSIPLEVFREHLLGHLDQPALTQRFLAGAVTFATLMPMRAIPFRQVWILGMNDGDYPRSTTVADFDLMRRDYRPGDRSRRDDDRYLFLEALLSAREKLTISWVGRSIRDNAPRPPSVLVGQLRDHLGAGWRLQGLPAQITGHAARQALLGALTTEHPLQPFSRRYFEPGRDPRLFTYAHEWRVVHGSHTAPAGTPLPRLALAAPITLQELARFMRQPVGYFYSRRLGIAWYGDDETAEDEEVFQLDGLAWWALQDELLQHLVHALATDSGADPARCLSQAALRLGRAGQLPLPPFTDIFTERLTADLQAPARRYQELSAEYGKPLLQQVHRWDCADGSQFEATLPDLRCNRERLVIRLVLQASRIHTGDALKWHHLTRQWPAHLAAQLAQETSTVILGPDTELTLPPLPAAEARRHLDVLLSTYCEGLQGLLPLPCKTAFALLTDSKPREVYEGGHRHPGEREDHPGFGRFWPDYATLAADDRFAALSQRLYGPLLAALPMSHAAVP